MPIEIKQGDKVRLNFGFTDRSGAGVYEVVRVLPAAVDGEAQFRVRGPDGFERAVGRRQIKDAAEPRDPFKRL